MTLHIDGPWSGRSGHTIAQLSDGSLWRQEGLYYEHHDADQPEVRITDGRMTVAGMRRSVPVRRL
ncbi:hypothetical protein PlfCFBP13513_14990 [Plantibacter flavus]|uniref:hypothetical protein n=1 Tax=Plantibacter TaxID=190323 RepID=UPI0010C1944D|nr:MULTISPECIES: hypothetical protein [Plantibacter]MBD8103800.1 hypothetical protein [Plantibacter sp. CFBP 8775]TKJ96728.1 hypothetical protein PlfCFBP13513_14990 [Plantibacter flavus]